MEDLGRRRAIKHMHERLRRLTDGQLVALWFPGGRLDGGPLRDREELWRVLREVGITKELVELAVGYRPGMPGELVEVRMDAAFAPLNELGRTRSSAISELARRMREEERYDEHEQKEGGAS